MRNPVFKSRIARVLHWSRDSRIEGWPMLVAGLGFAGPMLAGIAAGRPEAGLVAALGSLAMSSSGAGEDLRTRTLDLAYAFAAGVGAMIAGMWIAGQGALGAAMVVLIAAIVSLAGGFSRPLARASVRFILFLVIGTFVGPRMQDPWNAAALVAAGALWTALVTLGVASLRGAPIEDTEAGEAHPAAVRTPTFAQRWNRWRRSLESLSAWDYPLRITASLAVAETIVALWPRHHSHWIALTVAIVVHRGPSDQGTRAFQRAAGTAAGVLAGGVLLVMQPPVWTLVAVIVMLAALRPALEARSYLAYSAAMTPLVLLLLDFGQVPDAAALIDRLAATLIGCTLALAAGRHVGRHTGTS